ncbi:hypothetical protein LP415_21180 [Polaromonas sp. P1(28)-8]|nr:hypothetical protein LP415_21180 [Polaromonas sp. P1(28)-8]
MKTLQYCACALLAASLLVACDSRQPDTFPGYAEAEYVRLAAPISGTLARLHLKRGDAAPASAAAFVLEQDSERAAREEAAYRVARAGQPGQPAPGQAPR